MKPEESVTVHVPMQCPTCAREIKVVTTVPYAGESVEVPIKCECGFSTTISLEAPASAKA